MYHFSFSFGFQGVTAQSHVAETQHGLIRPGVGRAGDWSVRRWPIPYGICAANLGAGAADALARSVA